MSESKIVYFRDRALELGFDQAYELTDPNKSMGALLDPEKPNGERNHYKIGDLTIWNYIIDNQ